MIAPWLPNDIARCQGAGFEDHVGWQWREGCEDCLRRTALRPGSDLWGVWMSPPPFTNECEYRIATE